MLAPSLWLWSLLLTLGAAAEGNPSLAEAKVLYEQVKYERALERLAQAYREPLAEAERVEVELYSGLSRFNLGHEPEALSHFEIALQLDRQAQLPPFSSPKAEALFAQAARRVAKLPPRPPSDAPKAPPAVTLIPDPLPAPVVPLAAPSNHRWVRASLGVGMGLSAVGGVLLLLRAQSLAQQGNENPFEQPAFEQQREARRWATGAYVAFGVAGAAGSALLLHFLLASPPPAS